MLYTYDFWLGVLSQPTGGAMYKPSGKHYGAIAESTVVTDYVDRLTDKYHVLLMLKSQVYGGSWESMIDDLQNSLTEKPYIMKLSNRIRADINRIEEMRQFEVDHGVNLGLITFL